VSNTAIVTITIWPATSMDPVALNDAGSVAEDGVLTVAAPGVLANDTDAEGYELSAQLVGQPTRGSVTLNMDGGYTYTPNANFHGSDNFTYAANDGALDSAPATVTITVNPVADAPVALDQGLNVDEDSGATPLVLRGTDADGDTLSYEVLTQPSKGVLSGMAPTCFMPSTQTRAGKTRSRSKSRTGA
jgi:VCBS repeat-containing protein